MRIFGLIRCHIAPGVNVRSVKSLLLALVAVTPAWAVTSGAMLNYSTWLPTGGVSYNAVDRFGAQYFSGVATLPCQPAAGGPQVTAGVYSVIGKLSPEGDSLAWSVCLAGATRGLYE